MLASFGCDSVPQARAFELVRSWKRQERVDVIDFSRAGVAAVWGSPLGDATLLHAPWQELVTMKVQSGGVREARFTGADRLTLVSEDGAVEVRREQDGSLIGREALGLDRPCDRALVSPDGRLVALDARVYDLETKQWVLEGRLPAEQSGLAIAAGRYVLTSGYYDRRVELRDLSGGPAREWRSDEKVAAAAVSDDAKYVAAATEDGMELWSVDTGKSVCDRSTSDALEMLRFGPGWIAAAGRKLHVWKLPGCQELLSASMTERATALDANGDMIAVGDLAGEVYVWELQTKRLVARQRLFSRDARAVRIHAPSRLVFASGDAESGYAVKLMRVPANE